MRCDDPGGVCVCLCLCVCAADQPHRAGSEQMRGEKRVTLGRKVGGVAGRARQSAEQCPLPPHRLRGGSSKQDRITASPVETTRMVQSNIQHCAQRILQEQEGPGTYVKQRRRRAHAAGGVRALPFCIRKVDLHLLRNRNGSTAHPAQRCRLQEASAF